MIVVIQCAATKRPKAGSLLTHDGRRVLFVAQPQLAPPSDKVHYARPDDPSDIEGTWRDALIRYNATRPANPLGLARASELYIHPAYARLEKKVGTDRLFILSAGWGLLPASFLTPHYDITFSSQAERYKRRQKSDSLYRDFSLGPNIADEPMFFFGGKEYAPLFVKLTQDHKAPRTIFFRSNSFPKIPGCRLERYETNTRTNWHYECAGAWLTQI